MSTKKILVDEMDDGMDERLNSLGYEAYSVKKLRTNGSKLYTDYSVINYAKENDMILVTRDTESDRPVLKTIFHVCCLIMMKFLKLL